MGSKPYISALVAFIMAIAFIVLAVLLMQLEKEIDEPFGITNVLLISGIIIFFLAIWTYFREASSRKLYWKQQSERENSIKKKESLLVEEIKVDKEEKLKAKKKADKKAAFLKKYHDNVDKAVDKQRETDKKTKKTNETKSETGKKTNETKSETGKKTNETKSETGK